MARATDRPTLAVWKFASCDGCPLQVLSLADQLLTLAERVDVALFLEATSRRVAGPYDISLVERSITTPDDERRIREIRAQSKVLVTIGACATSGGIQALRNVADVDGYAALVYANPEYLDTLATSTGIADHVTVDFELRGCPVSIAQLAEVVTAFLDGRRPGGLRVQRLRRERASRSTGSTGRRCACCRCGVPATRCSSSTRSVTPP